MSTKNSHFDSLYESGARMGFKKGGYVTKSEPTVDSGLQPARKGTSQQEIEAGGTPKLKPGYKKGGSTDGEGALAKSKTMIQKRKDRNREAMEAAQRALGAQATDKEKKKASELKVKKKRGGAVGYQHVGGPHPEDEYPESKANQKMPKTVKRVGGPVAAKKGGRPVHNSTPMIGK